MIDKAIDAAIRKTFQIVKEDYLCDKFKYLSETDLVFYFTHLLTQDEGFKPLIDNGTAKVHFEMKPMPELSQADLVILVNENKSFQTHSVLEFKIRVDGNKPRCLMDLEELKKLNLNGIKGYVLIFDRCAKSLQVKSYVDDVFPSNEKFRENIFIVCDSDMGKYNSKPHNSISEADKKSIIKRASKLISDFNGKNLISISEADLVFEFYQLLISDPSIMGYLQSSKIDIHCEIRPYIYKGKSDFVVVKDKNTKKYFWKEQKVKNQGVRIDLGITTRSKDAIDRAYTKAVSDQRGKMRFWRILSHPVDNIIFFVEFKKNNNIKDDISKLECIHSENGCLGKYIIFHNNQYSDEISCKNLTNIIYALR